MPVIHTHTYINSKMISNYEKKRLAEMFVGTIIIIHERGGIFTFRRIKRFTPPPFFYFCVLTFIHVLCDLLHLHNGNFRQSNHLGKEYYIV